MKGERAIQQYVEASLEYRTLKTQRELYPELTKERAWMDQYNLAVSRRDEFYRRLTGKQIGEARRRLA